ncbi:MAG: ABC transporter ATP-binding protein [Oscillospiraceae bacterium]|nr:ABC transporter ATP-binding protein [Oscillospiraceae bacterium]
MDTAIKMTNVHKSFGESKVINDVSISIQSGELIGFLGPSGAGKTTTIKLLTGQLRQEMGTAEILGKSNTTLNHESYKQIGIVSDNSGLYENLNAYDNLLLFSRILNVDAKKIKTMLERVGLKEHAKKTVKKFSRGMKQRLVLARALMHNPKVLFLDEPTSGLDPSTTIEIHKLMMEMKEGGTTFFLTTHDMTEASKLCDRIVLFNEGKIIDMGTLDELSQKYNTNKYVQILLTSGESIKLRLNKENSTKIADLIANDQIATMHTGEPTLETIFLKLTGRGLQ